MEHEHLHLRNVSAATKEWLLKIGVVNNTTFQKLGAEKTYKLLLEAGHEADTNVLYALKGAELDLDWRIVAERERRKAKSRFAEVDEP